jgi:hypothetical protein
MSLLSWTTRPPSRLMKSVVLVHGVIWGMGHESDCEMLALKETDSVTRRTTFSRCSVIQANPDLPDGDYIVAFQGNSVSARRAGGLWLANGELLFDAA